MKKSNSVVILSKRVLIIASFVLFLTGCSSVRKATVSQGGAQHIAELKEQLYSPNTSRVLVASHRCDWRNHPENSIPALLSSIEMGVDIVEIDLKETKDGHLILLHDKTLDRSTSGKGKPEDFSLEEIKKLHLKNGLGRVTDVQLPTFEEFLEVAKGKVLINVDKGYTYFPKVVEALRETGTLSQAIINIDRHTSLQEVEAKYGKIPDEIILMPIINYSKLNGVAPNEVIDSYLGRKNTIFQFCWDNDEYVAQEDFIALKKQGYGIWLNSLWPALNGGHDDDRAVEHKQPDETWGWLIKKGASIIQTDRPAALIPYLKQMNVHK